MKILAIDTSTSVLGVALMDEEKVYAETISNLKRNHSIKLMPIVDQLFTDVEWNPKDIDLIAVAKGPGSYTGLRIGVTTAKTYAWALDIPLVGVSTLAAMAYSHRDFNGVISPIIDARRGQVYTGLYKNINDKLTNISQDCIILLSEWVDILLKNNERVIFVGDDISQHYELLKQFDKQITFSSIVFNIPRPSMVGALAMEQFGTGCKENIYNFAPEYLQLVEAEVKLIKLSNKG
ncbi:MAG: tRNA (adenosine(37)-N6)-threonylcarbamoyltransferase complex dimerization subunit type 1 TsaB [Vulcanibacillus sp.]